MTSDPTLLHEHIYWQQGITLIAGVDEVGMGALAGPVVAAAVILTAKIELPGVRDSKVVAAGKREKLVTLIKEKAVGWAIGEATVAEISALNIRRASHLAMQRAVDLLPKQPELLLIDGNPAQPHPQIPAVNIIDGDALSLSIAAASILAKVHRDALMLKLAERFPAYGFEKHKGYGSPVHLASLAAHGPCPEHRTTYAPVANAMARAHL